MRESRMTRVFASRAAELLHAGASRGLARVFHDCADTE
jgi:hypothetical protein